MEGRMDNLWWIQKYCSGIQKLKPNRNLIWPRMSKMTRRASISTYMTKGRLGQKWAYCTTIQVTWLHGMWKGLRYWMLPLHQSLLASLILQKSPVSEAQGKVWSKDDIPLVEKDQVRKYLWKLPTDKSMHSDGMHPKALR